MKTIRLILLLLLIGGMAGCGGSSPPAPSTTSPPPPPTPVIAVFSDPAQGSTFTTSDVRDVDNQIVRFDTANSALIWVASGQSFTGFTVNGLFLGGSFQVRFGTDGGERRAYFTEVGPATICDIEVINGQLVILPTTVGVPGGS